MEVEYLDVEVERKADAVNFFSVATAKGLIENSNGELEIVGNTYHLRQNNFDKEKQDEFVEGLVNGVDNKEQHQYNVRLNNQSFNNFVEAWGTRPAKWKGLVKVEIVETWNGKFGYVLKPLTK